jgi:hypothetical protein
VLLDGSGRGPLGGLRRTHGDDQPDQIFVQAADGLYGVKPAVGSLQKFWVYFLLKNMGKNMKFIFISVYIKIGNLFLFPCILK